MPADYADEVEVLNPYTPPETTDTDHAVEKPAEQRIRTPCRIGFGFLAVVMLAGGIDATVDLTSDFQLLTALQIFMACELILLTASLAITGKGGWTLIIYLWSRVLLWIE